MKLSSKIKELRQKNYMSAELLAKKIGVTKQTIYNYEAGKSEPSHKILSEMSNIFDINFTEFHDTSKSQEVKEMENKAGDYLTKYIKKLEDDLNEALKDKEVYRSIAERLMGKFRASGSSICIVRTIIPFLELGMTA